MRVGPRSQPAGRHDARTRVARQGRGPQLVEPSRDTCPRDARVLSGAENAAGAPAAAPGAGQQGAGPTEKPKVPIDLNRTIGQVLDDLNLPALPNVGVAPNQTLPNGAPQASGQTSSQLLDYLLGLMRRGQASIVANPVLVGAVTVLVVVVAVFLAYNANNGLPFVPTKEINVDVSNGANLVKGNEVRRAASASAWWRGSIR